MATALEERPRSEQPTKITAELEVHVTPIACSEAPAGTARWTLALLTERVIELNYVAAISDETIRKVLKKSTQTLARADLVHRHDDERVPGELGRHVGCVRAAYRHGPRMPVLRRAALTTARPRVEPDSGQTGGDPQRTPGVPAKGYLQRAAGVQHRYRPAPSVSHSHQNQGGLRPIHGLGGRHPLPGRAPQQAGAGQLHPHTYEAFYEHLPVEKARHLRHQLAFHFTPRHGAWLNRTEIEFSALSRQCLNQRIGSAQQLEEEALIWQAHRNAAATKICWSFTTEKVRDKLNNQYQEAVKKE